MNDKKEILNYFNESWLPRLRKKHNQKSLAMHLGYFENDKLPSDIEKDEAKSAMNEFLAKQLPLLSNNEILLVDAGCGIGGSCIFLAEKYNNINVIGVNIDEDQIQFAKELVNQRSLTDRISFLIQDYTQTSIESDSADGLYAMESMCYASDKKIFLKEAYRILKPKGTLLIFDYFLKIDIINTTSPEVKELLHDFSVGWAVKEYPKINIENDVLNSGFSFVESKSLNENVFSGIRHSYNKSIELLNSTLVVHSDIYKLHLKALIALKKLIELGVIDYRMIKAVK
jgi:tocopherol O-methyltransferase